MRSDEAIGRYREAVRLDPANVVIRSNLGAALLNKGQLDEAVTVLREAVRLDPKNAVAHDNLGICLSRLKKPGDAIACHRRSIEIDPKNVRGHELLLVNLLAVDRLGEAVAACRHAVKAADLTHAGARQQLGRQLNNAAWQLVTHPDPKARRAVEAVGLAGEAVRLMPDALAPGAPRSTLGVAHFRAGNYKDAVAALQQSVTACNGGNSVDWFFLAMAHWHLGDRTEARKWYDKAAAWMDEHRAVNEVLTRLRAEAGERLGVAVVRGAEVAPPPRMKK
jgi:Flp pilus assembly protein TadD